jgi:hypothetical protein
MLVCIYVPTVHMTRVLLVIKTLGQISSFVIFTTNFVVNSLKSKKKEFQRVNLGLESGQYWNAESKRLSQKGSKRKKDKICLGTY